MKLKTSFPSLLLGAPSKKPWPTDFIINFDKCSNELKKQMSKGMSHLNWQNRHELLNILAEEISQYTLHPDIKQRKQVAAQLIKMYPALKSSIGDGLNGWAERIYAKMKDYRLKLGTPESKAVRKKKEKKDASESIKVPHRGETNFLPSSVIPSDDENSMISWMKEESKKPNSDQDKKKIEQYLLSTFPVRRQNLTKDIMPLKEIKEKYPLLFTADNLIKEFKLLQDTDIQELIVNLKEIADKIIFEAGKKYKTKDIVEPVTSLQKKRASALEIKNKIISFYEEVNKFEMENTLLCAFLLLPIVLHDDSSKLYRFIMTDSTIENVAADTSAPIIIFVGNPFESTELYICGENEILVNNINDGITAITALFCIYYVCNIEYPPSCLSTYLFLQNYLLKLHYGKKLPPKLINLIEKF